MENNLENLNNIKHFPDTVGSLKIFGFVLLSMLLFAPMLLIFNNLFGRDIGFGVYYRTRNLAYAIIIHAANNFFALVPTFFIDETVLLTRRGYNS